MVTLDPYTTAQAMDASMAARMADALEQRGVDDAQRRFRDDYLARLPLGAHDRILDLGCGTGVLARHLAARPDFAGRVTGIDHSAAFVERARALAAQEGLAGVEFEVGDVHALALPDGTFDGAVLHTLLSHVRDPRAVVAEAARVVRPGGWVAIFDGDYAGLVFHDLVGAAPFADHAATLCAQPCIMRDLPDVLAAAGLDLAAVLPYTYAEVRQGGYLLGLLERFSAVLARSGDAEAQGRVDRLRARSEAGRFFAAVTYYAYLARRP